MCSIDDVRVRSDERDERRSGREYGYEDGKEVEGE